MGKKCKSFSNSIRIVIIGLNNDKTKVNRKKLKRVDMAYKNVYNKSMEIIKQYNNDKISIVMRNGMPYFRAKEICDILNLNNVSRALSKLEKDDITTSNVIDTIGRKQSVYFINEYGLYDLILTSKKEEAKKFKRWITHVVLPSIRKSGYYSIYDKKENITEHTKRPVQIENSKEVNKYYYHNGGVEQIIEHNRRNCVEHTGKTTKEIKQDGKDAGLKSNQRSSAKEVLRYLEPEKACSMSLADKLIYMGGDPKKVYEITRNAIKVFDGMIKLNIDVGLEDNKKDLLDEKGE